MARWVLHPETLPEIDGHGVLNEVADDVARDAERFAPRLSGDLALSVHKEDAAGDSISIAADAAHHDERGNEGHYAYWAEVGTSDTPASRFLERALYRQRNP